MSSEISYENMCDKLVEAVPELSAMYQAELEWWKGEKPGPYNIYPYILPPLIVSFAEERNEAARKRIFDFLELLLASDDPEVGYVVHDLMESMASWNPFHMPNLRPLMPYSVRQIADELGPYDKEAIRQRMRRFLEMNSDKRPLLWDLLRQRHLEDPLFVKEFGNNPETWLDE